MDIGTETDKIKGFVDRGNYHAAFNIALSALNQCRRDNDQAGVDTFLDIIKVMVQTLAVEVSHQESKRRGDK